MSHPVHPRQAIRLAVAQALMDAGVADGRVQAARILAVPEEQLPAVFVFTNRDEVVGITSETRRILRRRLSLIVDIHAAVNQDLDDTLDALALHVEAVVQQDPFWLDRAGDPRAVDTVLADTQIGFDEADRKLGVASLTFHVLYDVAAHELPKLDDFVTAHADWNFPPPDQVIEAQDDVTLEQDP